MGNGIYGNSTWKLSEKYFRTTVDWQFRLDRNRAHRVQTKVINNERPARIGYEGGGCDLLFLLPSVSHIFFFASSDEWAWVFLFYPKAKGSTFLLCHRRVCWKLHVGKRKKFRRLISATVSGQDGNSNMSERSRELRRKRKKKRQRGKHTAQR